MVAVSGLAEGAGMSGRSPSSITTKDDSVAVVIAFAALLVGAELALLRLIEEPKENLIFLGPCSAGSCWSSFCLAFHLCISALNCVRSNEIDIQATQQPTFLLRTVFCFFFSGRGKSRMLVVVR